MSVLILSDAHVRDVLDMESCIASMRDVLTELAKGGLTNPLRFVMRPPIPCTR
jgi:ornithine cyclodeaminase/alanine dehydrogenase-like protein (mu-crystallin family)